MIFLFESQSRMKSKGKCPTYLDEQITDTSQMMMSKKLKDSMHNKLMPLQRESEVGLNHIEKLINNNFPRIDDTWNKTRLCDNQNLVCVNRRWAFSYIVKQIYIMVSEAKRSKIKKMEQEQHKICKSISEKSKNRYWTTQIQKRKFRRYRSPNDKQFGNSLRGGGCGTSALEKQISQQQDNTTNQGKLPSYFLGDLVKYLNIIINKASIAQDEKQKEEILLAIQWFIAMKEYFNTLCFDSRSASSVYDLIFESLPQLLKSAVTYLRISGFLCIQVLQIINDLCRVLFTFFMKNKKRFLKIEDKDYLDQLISNFETQLDIESSNIWIGGAEFEINMIKAVIQSSPSNSDEGQKLLISFLGGLVQSVLTMSPSNDLIDSLIGGAKFLYQVHKVQDLKKKYEVYYYFESLKWYMIQLLRQDVSIKRVIQLLRNTYKNYIENSNDWIINFCWVKLISSLIAYRPIISKQELSINKVEQQKKWNQLIKNKFVIQQSFNANLGKLSLFSLNSESQILNQIIQQLGIKPFQKFSEILLQSIDYSSINIFVIKDMGKQSQIKLDYLYELLHEKHELEEPFEQINLMVKVLENLFEKIQKGQENFKTSANEKPQNTEEMVEIIQETIKQSFFTFSLSLNIYNIHVLYLERFKIIANSIDVSLGQDQIIQLKNNLLEQLQKVEIFFHEKCEETLNLLQNQQKNLICFLVRLEVLFQSKEISKVSDQIMKQKSQDIPIFINSLKLFIQQFSLSLENIKKMMNNQINYKRNLIRNFASDDCLSLIQQITMKIVNKNYLKPQILIIFELYQALSKQSGDLDTKLVNYYSLKYLILNLINCITDKSELLENLKNFIQKNNGSFTDLTQNKKTIQADDAQSIIKGMLSFQHNCFQQFFRQQEKQSSSTQENDKLSVEQILTILNNDLEQLAEMQNILNDQFDLKAICFEVAVVIQYFTKYLNNPEKINHIKGQINKIYKQRDLMFLQENQIESTIQQQFQLQGSPTVNQTEKLVQLISNLMEVFTSTKMQCQTILDTVSDKIELYENFKMIEIQANFKMTNNEIYSEYYEAQDTLIIKDKFDFLTQIELDFKVTNTQINHSGCFSQQQKAMMLNILLYFCDTIRPQYQIKVDQNIMKKAQQYLRNLIDDTKQEFEDQNYKARQCYVVSLISAQSQTQEQNIIKFCQDKIVQIWTTEKDERVKSLMKNQELIKMQKSLFSNDMKSFSKRLQQEMEERLNKISELEQKIYLEGDSQVRQQIQEQLQAEEVEFEDYLDNINDMASKLDIGIQFLKDIKRSLTQLKQKIDKLQDTINDIGDDVRKLRGKSFKELLDIRKRKVLEQMQLNSLNQIYISLECQEWDPVSGKQEGNPSILLHDNFQNQEGEINEFLQKEQSKKEVLLLRGVAGSGKSRAAGKIEQFLWQKIDSKESSWIPIYVSLPTLKEPKFNLIDQALESDFYQFDKIQVKEFKEALEQQKQKIILILDSYDEMKQDCIQSNLIHTNRFKQNLFGDVLDSQKVKEFLKVIITTRTEVLTSNSYQTWFYGDTIEALKEVELLQFNSEQQTKYLEEFTLLSMKKEILEIYIFMKQILKEKINIEEFYLFWKKILDFLMKIPYKTENQGDQMMSEQQIRQIIDILKEEKIFSKVNKDQIINLQKKLMDLWSVRKFKKIIEVSQIQDLLTTPFMMEIIVQVLPSMTHKYSEASTLKNDFLNNYILIKQQSQVEQQLIIKYKNNSLALQQLPLIQNQEIDCSYETLKKEGLKIWDNLQNEPFFKKFSLFDQISKHDLQNIDETSIIIRALMIKKLNVFDFYMSFVGFYHQQQIRKQQELGNIVNYDSLMIDLLNFSQSLAIDLTIRDLSQIKYISKGQLTLKYISSESNNQDDWLDVYFNDFKDNGDYKKLIRSCILLTSKGGNHCFTHKSIQEFYVGHFLLKLFDELQIIDNSQFKLQMSSSLIQGLSQKLQQKDQAQKQETLLTQIELFCSKINTSLLNSNQFNLSNDNYKGVMSIIKEELKQKSNLASKLINILKLSQFQEIFTRASSNGLYLLGYINEFLGNQQLENLRISDIDLAGISFYGSDLNNSQFSNINLSSCNFNKAKLQNCNWTDIQCDELHALIGHKNNVQQIIFSRDGNFLTSVCSESIKVWNIKDGSSVNLFTTQYLKEMNSSQFGKDIDKYELVKGKFSSDQKLLAIQWDAKFQDRDYTSSAIQIINLGLQKSLGLMISEDQRIQRFRISHDYNFVAYFLENSNAYINIFYIPENKKSTLTYQKQCFRGKILFSTNDQILISYIYKDILLWDYKVETKLQLLTGHKSHINDIALQPNGSILASCEEDKLILWNLEIGEQLYHLEKINQQILSLKFRFDGISLLLYQVNRMLSICDLKERKIIRQTEGILDKQYSFRLSNNLVAQQIDSRILIWDIEVGKNIYVIEGQSKKIAKIIYSPQNQILATICYRSNTIHLWDSKIQKISNQLMGHKGKVQLVGFSPDGQILYSYSNDDVILWDVNVGKKLYSLKVDTEFQIISFAKNGQFLFLAGNKNQIWYFRENRLITLINWQKEFEIQIQDFDIQHQGAILGWVFNSSKKIYDYKTNKYKPLDCKTFLFDLYEQKEVGVVVHPFFKVKKLRFSPNGEFLALINYGEDLQFWHIRKNIIIFNLKEIEKVEFSPDSLIIYNFGFRNQKVQLKNQQGVDIAVIQENQIVFSFESYLAVSLNKETINIWNLRDGQKIMTFQEKQVQITELELSPNGKQIATHNKGKEIHIWNVEHFELIYTLSGHKQPVSTIMFSTNGDKLASFGNQELILWDLIKGEQIGVSQDHKKMLLGLIFSPNDQILVACLINEIILYNTFTFTLILSLENPQFFDVSEKIKETQIFSADNQFFASCNERIIRIVFLQQEYRVKKLLGHLRDVEKIQFSFDNSMLVSFGRDQDGILSWDLKECKLKSLIEGNNVQQKQSIISNDDKMLACHRGDKEIKLYDTETGQEITTFKKHKHFIEYIAFSPDNNYLASCSRDFNIILWNIKEFNQYALFEGHEDIVTEVIFSPDSKILVSNSFDFTIRVWDITTKQQISIIQKQFDEYFQGQILFSHNGQIFAYVNDSQISIWEKNKKNQILDNEYSTNLQKIIGFNPNNDQLYIHQAEILSFSWDLNKLKKEHFIEQERDKIRECQLTHNCKIMVLVQNDYTLKFYDLVNRKTIALFKEHTDNINQLSFSPDDRIMATCSNDGTVKLTYIPEIKENDNSQIELILSSHTTFATYYQITAYDCQIQGANIQLKGGWDLKQLFRQKGAKEIEE